MNSDFVSPDYIALCEDDNNFRVKAEHQTRIDEEEPGEVIEPFSFLPPQTPSSLTTLLTQPQDTNVAKHSGNTCTVSPENENTDTVIRAGSGHRSVNDRDADLTAARRSQESVTQTTHPLAHVQSDTGLEVQLLKEQYQSLSAALEKKIANDNVDVRLDRITARVHELESANYHKDKEGHRNTSYERQLKWLQHNVKTLLSDFSYQHDKLVKLEQKNIKQEEVILSLTHQNADLKDELEKLEHQFEKHKKSTKNNFNDIKIEVYESKLSGLKASKKRKKDDD